MSMREQFQATAGRAEEVLTDLSPRDRRLLVGLVCGASLVLVLGLTWWMSSRLNQLSDRLVGRQDTLRMVAALAEEQSTAVDRADDIEDELARHSNTNLSAFLEQAASRAGIEDMLDSVRENSSTSDGVLEDKLYSVELSKIDTAAFANFLYEVETAGYPLKIRSTKVKVSTRSGEKQLRVSMDVSAFSLVEDSEEDG